MKLYGLDAAKMTLALKGGVFATVKKGDNKMLKGQLKGVVSFFGKAHLKFFDTALLQYEQEYWKEEKVLFENEKPEDNTAPLVNDGTIPRGSGNPGESTDPSVIPPPPTKLE